MTAMADRSSGTRGAAAGVALVPVPVAEAIALAAGTGCRRADWHPDYPTADTVDAVQLLLGAYAELPGGAALLGPGRAAGLPGPEWWLFSIVVDGQVVGDAGFHGPPSTDEPVVVEIGYQVVPAHRGRGVASRACGLLLAYAWDHGALAVRAETAPDNLASRSVLRRCGFGPDGAGGYLRERDPAPSP